MPSLPIALVLALVPSLPVTEPASPPSSASPVPAALGITKTFTFATGKGIDTEYKIEHGAGDMYTGLFRLENNNPYPVQVSFEAVYTLPNGKVARSKKGPITIKAGGHHRMGWGGEGDIWYKHEIPTRVSLESFVVEKKK